MMVSSNLPELSLDWSPPVNFPDFMAPFSLTENWVSDDFISALEDELKKIQAFKRELPLSYLLLNDAIGKLKDEAKKKREKLKDGKFNQNDGAISVKNDDHYCDMKQWMSSAQLWSPRSEEDSESRESEACKKRGAFGEEKEEEDDSIGLSLLTPGLKVVGPGSRSGDTGGMLGGLGFSTAVDQAVQPQIKPPYIQSSKKQRRCWSPELHRRFVVALEKLGGSQVATPKQIRELMQVDGLTNDEVKSHLQKYRLHVRKLPSSRTSPPSSNDASMNRDQIELGCSTLDLQHSTSPEGPLHLARSGKCNSVSMEEEDEEEKSDGQSWKVQNLKLSVEGKE